MARSHVRHVGGIRSRTSVTIQTRGPRGGESLAHVPPTPNYLTSLIYIDTWKNYLQLWKSIEVSWGSYSQTSLQSHW